MIPIPYLNAKGIDFARQHLAAFPRPDRQAIAALDQWLPSQGIDVPAEQIVAATLHYQAGSDGWNGVVVQRQSLAQALLSNWQAPPDLEAVPHLLRPQQPPGSARHIRIVSALQPPHQTGAQNYYVLSGLFRRSEPQVYDQHSMLPLSVSAFQSFVWDLDFNRAYKAELDTYWSEHFDSYRDSLKLNFIAACNKQISEGSLSDEGRRLAFRAAGVMHSPLPIDVRMLNVYGYASTDLVCLQAQGSDLIVLYVPGNASPLLSFANQGELQDWFGQQCRSAPTREALQARFNPADTPDGLSFSGLETALGGLGVYPHLYHLDSQRPGFTAAGVWAPREYVNYKPSSYSPTLSGDLFHTLATRYRQRSYQDADFLIHADSEVSKARWRGYLSSAMTYLAPLALAVPELWPLFAVGGIAQFGLGLDQALQARSQSQASEGLEAMVFGLFNAAPLALESAARISTLLRVKSDNFVFPSRVNERWGYPLSPVSPPHLPDLDMAPYFHVSDPIAPLAGADPAVSAAVVRNCLYDGTPDRLEASLHGYNAEVVYDLEQDAFMCEEDINEVNPRYFTARPGRRDLARVDVRQRPVDDAMRSASLRALGVDLQLPVVLPEPATQALQPIARTLTCLWVGDKVLSEALIANLAHNAQLVQDSSYTLRLLLSRATPSAFEQNLAQLVREAPSLHVLPLEDQAFFVALRNSKYHTHYQAAIDGGAFAAASDILRYRMLYHDGGLYMDVDDTLLGAGGYRQFENGVGVGTPGEALDAVELATSPDGLLLQPPISNETLGMNCLFNTSFIGSHAGNPTLEAISEEIHTRLSQTPDFHTWRPTFAEDPAAFYRYARRLSALTGPRVVTDVIDRRLAALTQLRQVANLGCMKIVNLGLFVDLDRYTELVRRLLPLDRLAKVGSLHSWAKG
ncbi:mannosyltransferase [Pseudomonas parafulva]|uniref:Mannosyltransferase n=1 Tax=Pseudomonas parafulva TaxID=157782 RepID=A0AAI8KCL5_9PSED|nr:DUF6543 domain-containing protein [Pseudomonas parafulva]AXO89106.1 mannosyltransferase [Pseudomonas parafulva]